LTEDTALYHAGWRRKRRSHPRFRPGVWAGWHVDHRHRAPYHNAHRPHRSLGQRCPSSPDRAAVQLADVEPADYGGPIHEYRMVAW